MSWAKTWLIQASTGAVVRKLACRTTWPPIRCCAVQVGGDVGAAEPVDGLLRVSDHEQAALRHGHVGPAGRAAARAGGDADGQLDLDRVGVLELIQQQPPVALLQGGADGCAVRGMGEQVTGEHQQVVEFQLPLRASCLRGLEGRAGDAAGQAAQRGFQHGGAYRGGLGRRAPRIRS